MNRRCFLQLMAAYTYISKIRANPISEKHKLVIIGCGVGGMAAYKFLRQFNKYISITLIDKSQKYFCCFKSNEALIGEMNYSDLSFELDFDGKITAAVDKVDGLNKKIYLDNGELVTYDSCLISAGIDFNYENLKSNVNSIKDLLPHAWSGEKSFQDLREQLFKLNKKSIIVIRVPNGKYRCPPGPYERASQIASYIKKNDLRHKIVILGGEKNFSKNAQFRLAWKRLYNDKEPIISMITKEEGGDIESIDFSTKQLKTENGHEINFDLLNYIPDQQAPDFLVKSGLCNDGKWATIDSNTMESTVHRDLYIIGDSCSATPMPKSAFSAHSQATMFSGAFISKLLNLEYKNKKLINTCFSVIDKNYAISISQVYKPNTDGSFDTIYQGITPLYSTPLEFKSEYENSHAWFSSITKGIF
ncbi:hypothetical protein FKQ62_15125 [Vibrio sp. B1-2]|nr:hypothetical protein [Vibrio sp. B1-2]